MNNGTAVRRPIVAVLGEFKGHTKQTWCTSLELNWSFLRRVGADNAKCHEIYGHSMSFKGHLFVATKYGRGEQQALES